jgi:hypothetical protein
MTLKTLRDAKTTPSLQTHGTEGVGKSKKEKERARKRRKEELKEELWGESI